MTWPVDPARFLGFLGITTALTFVPGPAVLFCIASGARGGAAAVVGSVAGVTLGTLVWFVGAGFGLGALVTAAPWMFRPLSLFGLAYLVWLGAKAIWSGLSTGAVSPVRGGADVRASRRALRDVGAGFVVQITNPKTVLYFAGVLPPFLDPRRPLWAQLLAIGVAALAIDAVGLAAYGLGGAALAERLREPRGARAFALASGAMLLGAAALIGARL